MRNTTAISRAAELTTVCEKCHVPWLRIDRQVLAWSGGRMVRLTCRRCGWDAHYRGATARLLMDAFLTAPGSDGLTGP